jgi:hypothetical protein
VLERQNFCHQAAPPLVFNTQIRLGISCGHVSRMDLIDKWTRILFGDNDLFNFIKSTSQQGNFSRITAPQCSGLVPHLHDAAPPVLETSNIIMT